MKWVLCFVWGPTQLYSSLTLDSVLRDPSGGLVGPYGVLGIESRSAVYKVNTTCCTLSLADPQNVEEGVLITVVFPSDESVSNVIHVCLQWMLFSKVQCPRC